MAIFMFVDRLWAFSPLPSFGNCFTLFQSWTKKLLPRYLIASQHALLFSRAIFYFEAFQGTFCVLWITLTPICPFSAASHSWKRRLSTKTRKGLFHSGFFFRSETELVYVHSHIRKRRRGENHRFHTLRLLFPPLSRDRKRLFSFFLLTGMAQ